MPSVSAHRRRPNDVRVSTETRSRRSVQPFGVRSCVLSILFDLHASTDDLDIRCGISDHEIRVSVQGNHDVRAGPLNWAVDEKRVNAGNLQMTILPFTSHNNPKRSQ